jgi:hypothetical protein
VDLRRGMVMLFGREDIYECSDEVTNYVEGYRI